MGNTMKYVKAVVEIVYFTNRDVITTSGMSGGAGGSCRVPGHDRGNGCAETSGNCPGSAWKL